MKNKYLGEIERSKQQKAEKSRASGPRYHKDFAEQARRLVLLEQNQQQIADFFGVSPAAVSQWKQKHPEFRAALDQGKLAMGTELVGTAYQLATGKYKHVDERLVYDKKTGSIKTVDFGGTLEPDTKLLTLLLQKKFPEAFPEKQEIDLNQNGGIEVNVRVIGDEAERL